MPYQLEMLTGTILNWDTVARDPIIFPRQELTLGGKHRIRGGAHLCSPYYGPMPSDGPYAGITPLPQHGFVRDGNRYAGARRLTAGHGDKLVYSFNDLALTGFPWAHELTLSVRETVERGMYTLTHSMNVYREADGNPLPMPFSGAFHPYFATAGQPFSITAGEKEIEFLKSARIVPDESYYCGITETPVLHMRRAAGTVSVQIKAGYNGFCVWTDALERYVCVEPILWREGRPHMLSVGESVYCQCEITFCPAKG